MSLITVKETVSAIKKAVSFCKRRPVGRQKEGVLHYLANKRVNGVDRVQVDIREKFDTACWKVDTVRGRRTHLIHIGDDIAKRLKAGLAATTNRLNYLKSFAAALTWHEAEHGLNSEQDLPRVAQLCEDRKVPFRLLNLFEDARIEHLGRERVKDGRRQPRFGWVKWEECKPHTSEPGAWFFAHVKTEASSYVGDRAAVRRHTRWTGNAHDDTLVTQFYRRACRIPSTLAMIPLCEEWLRHFPGLPQGCDWVEDNIGGKECPIAVTEGKTGSGYNEGGGSITGGNESKYDGELATGDTPTSAEQMELEPFLAPKNKEGDSWLAKWKGVDWNMVRRLMHKLIGIVHLAGHAPTRVGMSGSRLHIPNVAARRADCFRGNRQDNGKPSLTFIIDCSGSMCGRDFKDGENLLLALIGMHRRGIIHADIFTTGGGKHCQINPHWKYEVIERLLPTHGCESVRATLEAPKVRRSIRSTDTTIVYTDAQLTDGNVNANQYRRMGVDLLGCVTVDDPGLKESASRQMARHFGAYFVEDSAPQLATRIVNHVARRNHCG